MTNSSSFDDGNLDDWFASGDDENRDAANADYGLPSDFNQTNSLNPSHVDMPSEWDVEKPPTSPLRSLKSLKPQDKQPPEPPSTPSEADLFNANTSLSDAPANPPTPPVRSLKSLRPQDKRPPEPPVQPPQPPAKGNVRSLKQQPPAKPIPPDPANMTYEEWERWHQQAELELQRQAEDPEDLLNAVPDWIQQEATADKPDQASETEFAPDWFMGLEEQKPEDVPNWFNELDVNNVSLVGVESAPITAPISPTEPPATPSDGDVPEWFAGAETSVENTSFDDLFVAEQPPLSTLPPVEPISPMPAAEARHEDWFAQDTADPFAHVTASANEPTEWDTPADATNATADPWWMDDNADPSATPDFATPAINQEADEDLPAWLRQAAEEPPVPPTPSEPALTPFGEADELAWLSEADLNAPSASPSTTPASSWDDPFAPHADASISTPVESVPQSLDEMLASEIDIDALLSMSGTGERAPNSELMLPSAVDLSNVTSDKPTSIDLKQEDKKLEELFAAMDNIPPSSLTPQMDQPAKGDEGLRKPSVGASPRTPSPQAGVPDFREGEVPDWLSELRPTEAPVPISVGDQVIRLNEEPVGRLSAPVRQIRERARHVHVDRQPAPDSGPLAGITGAISTAPDFIQTIAEPTPAASKASVTNYAPRVAALQKMLSTEEQFLKQRMAMSEAQREASDAKVQAKTPPKPAVNIRLDRYVITLLLAALILVPFFSPALSFFQSVNSVVSEEVLPASRFSYVADDLSKVAAGQSIIVAMAYAPSGAGEMDQIARIFITDMLRRGIQPVLVSTNPATSLHISNLMNSISNDAATLSALQRTTPLISGQDYVILRYLPGEALGIRLLVNALETTSTALDPLFSADLSGQPLTWDVNKVRSMLNAPYVLVAERPDDVQLWVEQYRFMVGTAPSIFLLSSSGASAAAVSYSGTRGNSANRIIGPLIGMRDLTLYERGIMNGATLDPQRLKRIDQQWQATSLGILGATLIILFGMLANTLRGMLQQRSKQ